MTTDRVEAAGERGGVVPDTHQKALAVNLDATSFGSFAEIGAGQEVARWFLRVGAASGTVAKTVSAYDKEVSDDLYGSGTRYVSRPRLEAMLESEWQALVHQVGEARGATTRFFAFANTIAARNFAGTNDSHGWIGLRFQERPGAEPCEIVLHVNLRDKANALQQEAVGVLGVNLIHALLPPAPGATAAANDLPARLFDNLTGERIEIDQVEMRGGSLGGCDMRALHLAIAREGRAEAITFTNEGGALAANEFLYKKAVLFTLAAGDPRDELSPEAEAACVDVLGKEIAGKADIKGMIQVRLASAGADASIFAANSPGKGAAMVTRHPALYRVTNFARRYTQAPLRFAITVPALMHVFDEVRYQHLDGRLLEGVARLFGFDVRVLVYPSPREELWRHLNGETGRGWGVDGSDSWVAANQIHPAAPLRHLYEYLLATGFLVALPRQ